jgi:hypothetical protein
MHPWFCTMKGFITSLWLVTMSIFDASLSLIVSMFDTYVSKSNVFMFMFVCDAYVFLCDVSMLDVCYVFTFMFDVLILVLDAYYVFVFMSNVYFMSTFMSNVIILVLDVYYVFVSMSTNYFVFVSMLNASM